MPDSSPTTAAYPRAALLGAVAGLRTQLPFALLARAAGRGELPGLVRGPFGFLRTRAARLGFGAAAIGEVIADKTPYVPNRIAPGPLAGRLVCGGLAGAVLARGRDRPISLGFALGAAGAVGGSFAGFYARRTLDRATGLPDAVWAVAEDLTALALARFALRD
jgi:uncharacterized membrane protein